MVPIKLLVQKAIGRQGGKSVVLKCKKITDWYSLNRLQLPSTEYHLSDFFNYNVPNKEDLRKLRAKFNYWDRTTGDNDKKGGI